MYVARMKAEEEEKLAGLDLMQALTGKAWEAVENLYIEKISAANGHKLLIAQLDAAFLVDKQTEMSEVIEMYFYKTFRETGETLQEYSTRHEVHHTALRKHVVEVPEPIKDCMYMHRAGLSRHWFWLRQLRASPVTT